MSRALLATALLLCATATRAQDHSHHHPPPLHVPTPAQATQQPHAAHRQDDADGYRPPALTDADRAAAFPDLDGHDMRGHMDDDPFVWMVSADRLEWHVDDGANALAWDAKAWFGHDRNRLWLRSEGSREHGHGTHAAIEALWGKPVTPWWDVLAGVRHDTGGPDRSWLAFGVQGMAPHKFEVQATAYFGDGGRSALQAELEYELLLTNRLILQPAIEAVAYARPDPARGLGSGLAEAEAGLRLRYEIRREFAPYIGIERTHRFGGTARHAVNAGEPVRDTRWVFGIRAWL